MDKYIGIDVHAASCTIAVVDARGKQAGSQVVATNGQEIVFIDGGRIILADDAARNWLPAETGERDGDGLCRASLRSRTERQGADDRQLVTDFAGPGGSPGPAGARPERNESP
jgi:hypothetical protein